MSYIAPTNHCQRASLIVVITLLASAATAMAAPLGQVITYQGQLKNASVPVNGAIHLRFSLWSDPVVGSQLGSSSIMSPVTATDGLFTVELNSAGEFGANAFNGEARWLQIEVCADGFCTMPPPVVLTPRQRLAPVHHALALPGFVPQENATSPNLIGGHNGNSVTTGAVGATIDGGGLAGSINRVTDDYGVVGGGANNRAGDNAGTTTDRPYAVVGGGLSNVASGNRATIGGGELNTANGQRSAVGGGQSNSASQGYAAVGGGRSNLAAGTYSTIAGGGPSNTGDVTGTRNQVTDDYGVVGGGGNNQAGDDAGTISDRAYATVSGGEGNTASGAHSSIAGGSTNNASASYAAIGGGNSNQATGIASSVGGGTLNQATGSRAAIAGGEGNIASGNHAFVGGGGPGPLMASNSATGTMSAITGGSGNSAGGNYSAVPGGQLNSAAGEYSLAAGRRAKADHAGAMVFADSTDADHASTGANQFLIRAAGGVGVNTNQPTAALHIGGTPGVDGLRFPDGTLQTTAASAGLWQQSGSDVYYNVGNVGIGTPFPTASLDVLDSSGLNNAISGTLTSLTSNTPAVKGTHLDNVNGYGIGVQGMGGFIGVDAIASNTAGSSVFAVYAEASGGGVGQTNVGVYAEANASSGTNIGVYGNALNGTTNYAGYFNGDVDVAGTLSKGGGAFKIDHPLDPENKYLFHSFVESPEMMNVYNDTAMLGADGTAEVLMPEWFEALNRDFRYQLTAIGAPAPNLHVARKVAGNRFTIAGGAAGLEVSWQVTGVRRDKWAEANRISVEVNKNAEDKGQYLHPEEYGLDPARGINHKHLASIKRNPASAAENRGDR